MATPDLIASTKEMLIDGDEREARDSTVSALEAQPNGEASASPLTLDDISEETKREAEEIKEKANTFFKKQEYDDAIKLYTDAINLNPLIATYFCNRSFAYLKTECFGYALEDANKALILDKTFVKAYYRRASANMALGKFKLALCDFETVSKTRPNDKEAKEKYAACNKIVKRIAFEKAISVDEVKKSVSESININTISVESDYDGPRLSDSGEITVEFTQKLMSCYKDQKKLHRRYAFQILLKAKQFFASQPSLVDITVEQGKKFTVCGDIHGQYYDLMNVFELNGAPSQSNPYLFNGDFVDRGSFSVECIFTLLSFKLLYPQHFYMSRGNHESETMNQMYGFAGEVKSKYSTQMCELFTEVYNLLPLCHCINSKILVMHGGLFSEDEVTLDDIRKIERNRQPPESGLMCELLWSDPQPQCGRSPSKRGVGIQFGPDVTRRFLQKNDLDYVIRSHEVKNDGYEVAHDGKCITVFSAPNYCDTMGNKGAYITLTGGDLRPIFKSYDAVPHPNVKPMAYANSLLSMFA